MSTLKRKATTAPGKGVDAKKPKANGSIASFFGAAPAKKPTVNFNKEKWVATLTPDQKSLLQLEIDTLDESWLTHLKDELTSPYFLELKRFLARETAAGKQWFPPAEDVYSWSRHTPFHNAKVVIVGQDPYHNVNQAHGLAFSVRPPTPAPPSLRNMYIALKRDYPTFEPPPAKGGLLTTWADRGVVMLNTCLTVRAHEAKSHSNRGWERFTQKVIDVVALKRTRGLVFMAWGTPAGQRVQKIDDTKHLVLKSVHPSPLSASRGFFDCGHFKLANEWLVNQYGAAGEIDWALAPGSSTKAPVEAVAKVAEGEAEAKQDQVKKDDEVEKDDEDDLDADDEEALEEAMKLAEQEAAKLVKDESDKNSGHTNPSSKPNLSAAAPEEKSKDSLMLFLVLVHHRHRPPAFLSSSFSWSGLISHISSTGHLRHLRRGTPVPTFDAPSVSFDTSPMRVPLYSCRRLPASHHLDLHVAAHRPTPQGLFDWPRVLSARAIFLPMPAVCLDKAI
ncbi:hypothetical protein G7046_g3234 [Stylonectria norvegica]|nr:hypothetical protein G7046_g3234 [Stylonectria norvegica]